MRAFLFKRTKKHRNSQIASKLSINDFLHKKKAQY